MSQTVLVADDSRTIRKIVEMALKGTTYRVIGVGSAQDAMEAARQAPSVILLDYYMPDGSGYDVCRALKSNPATREIPVVMLGGSYKHFDESLARQSGADGIVMKPFKTDTLLQAIQAVQAGASTAPPVAPVTNETTMPSAPTFGQATQTPPPQPFGQPQPRPYSAEPSPRPYEVDQTPLPAPAPTPVATPAPQPRPFAQPQPQPFAQPQPQPAMHTPAPFPVKPEPAPYQAAPQQAAGSQPRITTPDVNASTRQPTPQPAPTTSGGSGMANVGLSRSEIEKMIREEVKNAVKNELPALLRNVMGETFQQKVLPKLVEHTEQRVERMISDRIESQIKEQVRAELERLLAEE